MNHPDVRIVNNVGHFYFPIGDRTITDDILNSAVPYSIYVSLQLSLLDSAKKVVFTNLFAKAPVNMNSIMKSCESISAQVSLLATTQVDIAVGFVGMQQDWNSSVVVYRVRGDPLLHAGMIGFITLEQQSAPSQMACSILSSGKLPLSKYSPDETCLGVRTLRRLAKPTGPSSKAVQT